MKTTAIDLFAGWGGFTLGATQAGANVLWAANHWPLAVAAHERNHPGTVHSCQDLRQADWSALPPFELLLAAPACQGHSTASQPRRRRFHDALRATAWAVIDCADVTEPKAIVVENVPAFRRWRLYPQWIASLRQLGYHPQETLIRASQHGVPQRRERLFIIAGRQPMDLRGLVEPPRREAPFGPCIDWNAGAWRPVTACRGKGARQRIETARGRLGNRCLVQHTTGHRGIPLDEPIRTITTQDHWVVVDGAHYRPLTIREIARGMGFPDSYSWPDDVSRTDAIRGLGNAVCPPVARSVVEQLL